MHDAQNLFDLSTSSYGMIWDAGRIMDEVDHPAIIVGIDNGNHDRLLEYSPWENQAMETKFGPEWQGKCGGAGDQYLADLVYHVKPWVDLNYRTLSDSRHTSLGGSSMGGLISLVGILDYPQVFGYALCVSNAFWFARAELLDKIAQYHGSLQGYIYLDVGTDEASDAEYRERYIQDNQMVYDALVKQFDDHVVLKIIEGAKHNELAWQARFKSILLWMRQNG